MNAHDEHPELRYAGTIKVGGKPLHLTVEEAVQRAQIAARAVEVIRQLLELLDRKWLQIAWLERDVEAVDAARVFVEEVNV